MTFQYKTYKCVWTVELYETDGCGMGHHLGNLYEADFPTHEEALAHLATKATKGRWDWKWNNPPHSYVDCGIFYHERPV